MFREKIFGVLAKIETTSGTDAAPTSVNALRVVGIPTLKYGYLEEGLRDDVETGQLGVADRASPAGRWGSIDLQLEVRGAGAAYSASVLPESDVLLRAGGCSQAIVTTTSSETVTYTTLDTGTETCTLYMFSHNKLFKLVGCVATVKYSAAAAKRGFMNFTLTGRMVADPVESALATLTPQSTIPPLFHSVSANIGAWTQAAPSNDPLVLRAVDVDLGNVVTARPSAGATDGLAGHLIVDRKVRLSMTVETPQLSSFDPFAASKLTGAANPLTVHAIGTVQYNRLRVETGRWQLEKPEMGAASNINTLKLNGNLIIGAAPTTSREINFIFT
jgi:hypothetical protein